MTGSSEIRTGKMQTPIPSPLRSSRADLSSDKAIAEKLTVSDTLMPDAPSQDQPKPTSIRHTNLLGIVAKMSMRRKFVAHAPKIIEELFKIYIQITVLNVHPTTSTSTTTTSDLQRQLYLKMKSGLQSQVVDPELYDAFCKHDHDDHQGDNAPPEGEKGVKRPKTSRSSNSIRGSLSKQPSKETNTSASEQP
ncbi:hypothetical protein Tco_1065990 [Tanacetum coccineum]